MRVLVVDDERAICEVVSAALADEGHEVVTAAHGAAALDLIGEAPPDLILLDMRMPVMDGWQFAAAYRRLPGPSAPIICMTAAPDAPARAQDIRAAGYLGKPFDLDDLLSVVDRFAT
jgi:CheY-like chemotaxis protein